MTKTKDIIDLSDCQREREQASGVADQDVVADDSEDLAFVVAGREPKIRTSGLADDGQSKEHCRKSHFRSGSVD